MIQQPNQSIRSIDQKLHSLPELPALHYSTVPARSLSVQRYSAVQRHSAVQLEPTPTVTTPGLGDSTRYSSLIDRAGLRSALLAWHLLLLLLLLSSQRCSRISPLPLLAVLRDQLAVLSPGWRHLAHGGTSALHGHGGLLLLGSRAAAVAVRRCWDRSRENHTVPRSICLWKKMRFLGRKFLGKKLGEFFYRKRRRRRRWWGRFG